MPGRHRRYGTAPGGSRWWHVIARFLLSTEPLTPDDGRGNRLDSSAGVVSDRTGRGPCTDPAGPFSPAPCLAGTTPPRRTWRAGSVAAPWCDHHSGDPAIDQQPHLQAGGASATALIDQRAPPGKPTRTNRQAHQRQAPILAVVQARHVAGAAAKLAGATDDDHRNPPLRSRKRWLSEPCGRPVRRLPCPHLAGRLPQRTTIRSPEAGPPAGPHQPLRRTAYTSAIGLAASAAGDSRASRRPGGSVRCRMSSTAVAPAMAAGPASRPPATSPAPVGPALGRRARLQWRRFVGAGQQRTDNPIEAVATCRTGAPVASPGNARAARQP